VTDQLHVFGVELDQDCTAPKFKRDLSGCAGASERVKNGSPEWAPGEDARLDQVWWEGGEVGFGVAIRIYGPNAPLVSGSLFPKVSNLPIAIISTCAISG
jgi:hypothetical protein